MTSTTTLSELIARLDELSDNDTIFAWSEDGHWVPGSPAVVRPNSEYYYWHADKKWVLLSADLRPITSDVPPPPESPPPGFRYFLEVDIARDVVEVARNWYAPPGLTREQETLAVIYYAEHDAYISEFPKS